MIWLSLELIDPRLKVYPDLLPDPPSPFPLSRLLMLRTKELNTVRHLLTRQRALQHAAQTAPHGKA